MEKSSGCLANADDMQEQESTIFFSWQSELPKSTNWSFIEDAVEKALKELHREGLGKPFKPTRDTQDEPGSPDIVDVIFQKIQDCGIFLADVTPTHPGKKRVLDPSVKNEGRPRRLRPAPNSNVMVETGYAFGTVGRKRMILVINEAYGDTKDLPFDLHHTRITKYRAVLDEENRSKEKAHLVGQLVAAIKLILADSEPAPTNPMAQVKEAIESRSPKRRRLVSQFFLELLRPIESLSRPSYTQPIDPDPLFDSVEEALPHLASFYQLVEIIAEQGDKESLEGLSDGFEVLIGWVYNEHSRGYTDGDLFKFVAYLCALALVGALLESRRFELLDEYLSEEFNVFLTRPQKNHSFGFGELSRGPRGLRDWTAPGGGQYLCPVGELLLKLIEEGKLPISAATVVEADTILYIRSYLAESMGRWYAHTAPYMNSHPPKLLARGRSRQQAEKLRPLFGNATIEDTRLKITEAFERVGDGHPFGMEGPAYFFLGAELGSYGQH
jgi:hypothetical protein